MKRKVLLAAACAALVLGGCESTRSQMAVPTTPPQLFAGMGSQHRSVTTQSPEAQKYFDQGLAFAFAFNHDEAIRSFAEAARLDPACAMAWWGVALCNGPHINNAAMDLGHSQAAWAALKKAEKAAAHASPVEQALVRSLAARYSDPGKRELPLSQVERLPLDSAYAAAMRHAAEQFSADPDVATLYAEAMMDLRPWDLWTSDGKPQPGTPEIVSVLERVLTEHPDHPGANHLYIHAIEASPEPQKGLAAANRLETLVPAAGHMVHMPAHIYARVGQWEKAAESNRQAIAADAAYRSLSPTQGFYHVYMMHNRDFLAFACMMEGRSQEALTAAREMVAALPPEFLKEAGPLVDGYLPLELEILMRFGRWDEILAKTEPPAQLPISISMWHMCRGVAFANSAKLDEAKREQAQFLAARSKVGADATVGNSPASTVLKVAGHMLAGEILYKEGKVDEAIKELEEGARAEDTLRYDEPPNWRHPVRHILGAILLKENRAKDAEIVYRDDLSRWPDNGWALYGLMESIRAQGAPKLSRVLMRFERVWSHADVKIDSSCACVPGTAAK